MRLWTFRSWDDNLLYRSPRGWWFRLGLLGPGLLYRYIGVMGHHPLFTERHGRDRQIAIRFGPHLFTILRPLWGRTSTRIP